MYLAILAKGIRQLLDGKNPPGDGTEERDNGVRLDISFRTKLILNETSKEELKLRFPRYDEALYDESSEPYHFLPDYKSGN